MAGGGGCGTLWSWRAESRIERVLPRSWRDGGLHANPGMIDPRGSKPSLALQQPNVGASDTEGGELAREHPPPVGLEFTASLMQRLEAKVLLARTSTSGTRDGARPAPSRRQRTTSTGRSAR